MRMAAARDHQVMLLVMHTAGVNAEEAETLELHEIGERQIDDHHPAQQAVETAHAFRVAADVVGRDAALRGDERSAPQSWPPRAQAAHHIRSHETKSSQMYGNSRRGFNHHSPQIPIIRSLLRCRIPIDSRSRLKRNDKFCL